ncbi:hypothetical protein NPIL_254841, partial [Nephila pilipes]
MYAIGCSKSHSCIDKSVQTDFQPLDNTKFATNIVDADSVNHIVVFLTGATPFPDGFGGS